MASEAQKAAQAIAEFELLAGNTPNPLSRTEWESEFERIIQRCVDSQLSPYREWILNLREHPVECDKWTVTEGLPPRLVGSDRPCSCGLDALRQSLQEKGK